MTTYNVLAEPVQTDVGDIAFVLLGPYDAASPAAAKRAAARDFGIADPKALVAVSGRYWR